MRAAITLSLLASTALAGNNGQYPNANVLSGNERMLATQNGQTVNITPAQMEVYICSVVPSLCTGGGGGSGNVTTVSVVTANGFYGTVQTPTTTPAITLGTNVTGVLEGVSGAIAAAPTTGTGNVVLNASPALVTPYLDVPTFIDDTYAVNVPASQLIGTVSSSNLPGSSVRYSNPSTCTISSTDNGNIVNEDYGGSLATCTIPDINTSGITPAAFQLGLINTGVNAMLLQRTTSSLINGQASIPFAPGAGALIFADANNSTLGNYNYNAFITGEFAGSQPMAVWHDWSQSGTNISDWGLGTITGTNGQFCLYALKDQGYAGGFTSGGSQVFCATRGSSGTLTGQGVTSISIGSSVSSTTVSFPGGVVSFTSNIKAPALIVNGSTLPSTTGQSFIYQPASNQIGFGGVPSGTSTEYAYFDAAGSLHQLFDSYTTESSPRHLFVDTSQSGNTNQEVSVLTYASDIFSIGSLTDGFATGYSAFSATRGTSGSSSGQYWASETFGCTACATTFSFLGGNATFAAQVKAADIVVNGSALGATGTSGLYNPAGTQLGFFTNGIPAGYIDGNQDSFTPGFDIATGLPPVISCYSSCIAQNAGTGVTATFTGGGSAVITATSGWAVNEPVTLTVSGGSLPAAFNASTSVSAGSFNTGTTYVITAVGTTNFIAIGALQNAVGVVFTATGAGSGTGTAATNPYYVNSTGIASTTLQLCSSPATFNPGNTWTACTSITAATAGSGTITATGWNNYVVAWPASTTTYTILGGMKRIRVQLPLGTWSGATTLKYTWPSSDDTNTGIFCAGVDETAPAQITMSADTLTTCNLVKATTASAQDWWVMQAGGM